MTLRTHSRVMVAATLCCLASLRCTTDDGLLLGPDDGPTATTGNPPVGFALSLPDPSPFTFSTTVDLALPAGVPVSAVVQSATGNVVAILLTENLSAGHHAISWDGTNGRGGRCEGGVYFITVRAGTFFQSRTLRLQR